jgi:CRISPR-associated protein Cas2
MSRRRYLVAYDIRDKRRLRRVATTLEDFGVRAQYSVFLCDLSQADLADLTYALHRVIDTAEDSVLLVGIGTPEHQRDLAFLGRHQPWPVTGPRVI